MNNSEKNITAVLFGSRAKGTARGDSDADVGVLASQILTDEENFKVMETVAKMLHVSEDVIDLVDLFRAPVLLQYEVAKHGKFLFGEKGQFLRFRIRAWKQYWDMEKLRRMKWYALQKKYAW